MGAIGGGLLAPLWATIAQSGEIEGVYPDELMSIDSYSRGRISTGNFITAENVDHVRDLLEPVRYHQIKTMGRRLRVVRTTTDVMRLSPHEYLEATLRNTGMARFDDTGNVVTKDGAPWIGGNPFPNPKTGLEIFAGLTLSWGRHDASFYATRETDLSPRGKPQYHYESGWAEWSPTGRVVLDPKPYQTGHEDVLRYQSVFFATPQSVRGTAYLNIWPYDQNEFPELLGYIPDFRRIRKFPTNQRFEPLVPGSSLYLSDAWAAGDPLHSWGNYKIVSRGPFLAAVSGAWNSKNDDWRHDVHGGEEGQTFFDTDVELLPEAVVVEAEPTGFPRAPVSKKRVWFDARTMLPVSMVSYDRKGDVFKSFDAAFALYEDGDKRVMDGKHPYWSWGHVHAFDLQTGRMTRIEQVASMSGGHKMRVNDPEILSKYLTRSALQKLGGA